MTTNLWNIDGAHSGINFSIRHMVVSKVRGRFTKFSGALQLDDADLTRSTLDVHIDASSIDTGNDSWDKKLRQPDWFDAGKFPKIQFESTKVRRVGDRWEAEGTFHTPNPTGRLSEGFEKVDNTTTLNFVASIL